MRRAPTALALATLLLLTACSGSSEESEADRGAPASAGQESGGDALSDGGATDERAAPVTDVGAREAVIATATVSFHDEDLTRARQEVQRITDRFGGSVADEETESSEGEVTWTRMVLRIPTTDFDPAIDALEEVGELDATVRTTEVVTDQVRDNEARIRAQERSLRRLEALLDRAQDLGDVIRLESELGRRQADLDALKATQAWLADQTSMSTVNVHAHRTEDDGPAEKERERGFLGGLAAGWDSLAATGLVVATALGALVPWVPVLVVLVLPLWWLLRRRPRRAVPSGPAGQAGQP